MARVFSVCVNVRSAVAALFLVLLLPAALQASETFEREPLTIVAKGGKTHAFTVELAVTPNQRSQGLMNRREMADDHGMLFAFGETRQVLMWMKNTYLPLDMLFIGKDGKIRTIKENAEPLSEAIIDSKVSVDFVLELNGGTVEKLGIKPGHRVESALIERMRTANCGPRAPRHDTPSILTPIGTMHSRPRCGLVCSFERTCHEEDRFHRIGRPDERRARPHRHAGRAGHAADQDPSASGLRRRTGAVPSRAARRTQVARPSRLSPSAPRLSTPLRRLVVSAGSLQRRCNHRR